MLSLQSRKIGILLDSYALNEHENFILNDLCKFISRSNILLIYCGEKPSAHVRSNSPKYKSILRLLVLPFHNPSEFLKILLFRLIYLLEIRSARRIYPEFQRYCWNARDFGFKEISISKIYKNNNRFRWSVSPDDCNKLKLLNLDAICRLGSCSGIISGDILSIPKFGILSFHHGDNRRYRGGPSGFWEALYKEKEIGYIIQRLTEELDGGLVYHRNIISSSSLWLENSASLLYFSKFDFASILCKILQGSCLPEADQVSNEFTSSKIYRIKDYRTLLVYITSKFRLYVSCKGVHA